MEYLSTLNAIDQILLASILPSLILFLLYLQMRHLDGEQTLPDFIEYTWDSVIFLFIVLWPIGIIAALSATIILIIVSMFKKLKLKFNISFKFLVTDFKFK